MPWGTKKGKLWSRLEEDIMDTLASYDPHSWTLRINHLIIWGAPECTVSFLGWQCGLLHLGVELLSLLGEKHSHLVLLPHQLLRSLLYISHLCDSFWFQVSVLFMVFLVSSCLLGTGQPSTVFKLIIPRKDRRNHWHGISLHTPYTSLWP